MKGQTYFDGLSKYISEKLIGLRVNTHQGEGVIKRFEITYRFEADVDITSERGNVFNMLSNNFEFIDKPPELK